MPAIAITQRLGVFIISSVAYIYKPIVPLQKIGWLIEISKLASSPPGTESAGCNGGFVNIQFVWAVWMRSDSLVTISYWRFSERIRDVLKKDEAKDDVLVLRRVHVAAELVGREPKFGFEANVGRVVGG
jgi:hypothetical protein